MRSPVPPSDSNRATPPSAPAGLDYIPGLLSQAEQADVLAQVDACTWSTELKRRVQHYGYRYDYRGRRVDHSMYLGPLPRFADAVTDRLLWAGLIGQRPDQLIVNEYTSGQGIAPHVDCRSCFKDT